MNVLDMIAARLGEPNVQALGQKLGTDRNQTLMAVAHSFPVLLKGMAQNASQKEGAFALAGALDRDHDGSLLANVGQAIQNPAGYKGSGIVNHIFGNDKDAAAQQVAGRSGVSASVAGMAMETIAPMVLAFLGKKKRSEGMDAAGLAGFLFQLVTGGGGGQAAASSGAESGGIGGMLGGLVGKLGGMGGIMETAKGFIDKDKDGDVMDDLQGMLGGLFGGK